MAERSKIAELCCSKTTVSAEYAKDPARSPGQIAEKLYGTHHLSAVVVKDHSTQRPPLSQSDLDWAVSCGSFAGTEPSALFLRAFHDLLQPVAYDAVADCVSPPLIGSTGYVPMTIIAPLNDQLRHMSNLIVRARREVLLATNFWKKSGASTFVNDALVELSKRAGERGERVVVRIMYDRGSVKQVLNNHQNVSAKEWQSAGVGLPPPEKMPNIDLGIVNFHRPPLGTFHSKFMIIDREIATVSSNNIQDNQNLEMMSHLEGPIVDGLWETFLLSWHNKIDPPLPCRTTPAAEGKPPTYAEESFIKLFEEDGSFRLPEKEFTQDLPEHMPDDPHFDVTIADEINRMRSVLHPKESHPTYAAAVAAHLNKPTSITLQPTIPAEPRLHFFPFIPIPNTTPVPIALASRKPYPNLNNSHLHTPQNAAFLSLIAHAERDIFIQTPDLNAQPLHAALIAAIKRGVKITYYVCLGYNDTGELLPGQNGTNEMFANKLFAALSTPQEKELLQVYFYVAADQTQPIHDSFKQRSCHIKLLIADGRVAVQGSGNQDTQSWFHSQEVNVMVDSETVCAAWREGIERNQNTAKYGRASSEDGCWYDEKGVLAKGSYGTDAGTFSFLKGAVGILNKAEGK